MLNEASLNRVKLLALSFSPFVIGYFVRYAVTHFDWYGSMLSFITMLFCVYWYFVGYKSYDYENSAIKSMVLGNFFAIVSIILIISQGLILKRYLPGILGHGPATFFLPMLRAGVWISNILLFFTTYRYIEVTLMFSFLLMIVLYYAGYSRRSKQ